MSPRSRSSAALKRRASAPLFAALGDKTRLALVAKLSGGEPRSIAQLTAGTKLTRQAITKHLHVLERAELVHSVRAGRESRYQFDPAPLAQIKKYIDVVSEQWDQALARLKSFVER